MTVVTKTDLTAPLLAELTAFPLSGCKYAGLGCEATASFAEGSITSISRTGINHGEIREIPTVSWRFHCGASTECTVTAQLKGMPMYGGNPAEFVAPEMVAGVTSGVCPKEEKLSANFKITPKPMYLVM